MDEPTTTSDKRQPRPKRARRSTRVSEALHAARKRNNEQLAQQRLREEQVDRALEEYFAAADMITAAERELTRKIKPYEDTIAKLRAAEAATRIEAEAIQAQAALTIHDAERTVSEVGELLGLSEKAARSLIADGKAVAAGSAQARDATAEKAFPAQPGTSPESDRGPGGAASVRTP